MIRAYQSKDLESVLDLMKLNTPMAFHPSEILEFKTFLEEEAAPYFVVEKHGKILSCGGYAVEKDKQGKFGVICWDMTHPDYHGQGLGSSLLQFRVDILKEKGLNRIVVRTSQLADQYFAKYGFVLEYKEENFWADGFDLYFMSRKV